MSLSTVLASSLLLGLLALMVVAISSSQFLAAAVLGFFALIVGFIMWVNTKDMGE